MSSCNACYGSGEIIGLGHMKADCHVCDGTGKLGVTLVDVIDKESEEYIDAKAKIKEVDSSMSDKEAESILDDELKKFKKKG